MARVDWEGFEWCLLARAYEDIGLAERNGHTWVLSRDWEIHDCEEGLMAKKTGTDGWVFIPNWWLEG